MRPWRIEMRKVPCMAADDPWFPSRVPRSLQAEVPANEIGNEEASGRAIKTGVHGRREAGFSSAGRRRRGIGGGRRRPQRAAAAAVAGSLFGSGRCEAERQHA